MLYAVRRTWLEEWLVDAQIVNVTYFRVRRELYARLTTELRDCQQGGHHFIMLTAEQYFVLKQLLTSRNDSQPSQLRLAFDKTLEELDNKCRRAPADLAPAGP